MSLCYLSSVFVFEVKCLCVRSQMSLCYRSKNVFVLFYTGRCLILLAEEVGDWTRNRSGVSGHPRSATAMVGECLRDEEGIGLRTESSGNN